MVELKPKHTDAEIRAMAVSQYGSDDIEIDEEATVSLSEEAGAWVQAWVFVDFRSKTEVSQLNEAEAGGVSPETS